MYFDMFLLFNWFSHDDFRYVEHKKCVQREFPFFFDEWQFMQNTLSSVFNSLK